MSEQIHDVTGLSDGELDEELTISAISDDDDEARDEWFDQLPAERDIRGEDDDEEDDDVD